MLFNSYVFIFLFLPITWTVYYGIGKYLQPRMATLWLALTSLFFYGQWEVRYVPLLFLSTCFNFFISKIIACSYKKRYYLTIGILSNLLLLGYYKYAGFFIEVINPIIRGDLEIPNTDLPLGISFFTFTQTAYLIDVYWGEAYKSRFAEYLLFVTVFPHLIAGPILNHSKMMPQFSDRSLMKIDYKNLAMGLTLFAMGLFKKVVIADKLALFVNPIFSNSDGIRFIEAWIGALGYSLQLYFDFSAYSEMAIGLGLLFNMKLPQNFNSPYQADSIIDFWRRWHMTLGEWVRKYLYIPIGGNRGGLYRKLWNLLIVMTLVGLWHGAGWTFIIWGFVHGVYLVVNNLWRHFGGSMSGILARLLTFFSVVFAWVIFRADNIDSAVDILRGMCGMNGVDIPFWGGISGNVLDWLSMHGVVIVSGFIVDIVLAVKWIVVSLALIMLLDNPVCIAEQYFCHGENLPKWFCSTMFVIFIYALLGISAAEKSEFLYFQF